MTTKGITFKQTLQNKAPYTLAFAVALLIYELYLLQKSFLALDQIYENVIINAGLDGISALGHMWFFSAVSGEVGLILRFAGSIFFVSFATALLRKKPALTYLKIGVLLEAIQYLFLIPFLFQWVIFSGMASELTIVSFSIQILLITPTLLVLYLRLKNPQTNLNSKLKTAAAAAVAFMFAMWIKHFFFTLYALPIDFNNPALAVGFANSVATLLVSALILTIVFLPVIRGRSAAFSCRGLGAAFLLASSYFFIYIAVAAINPIYQSFMLLTELWMISLAIVGIGFITGKE